MISAAEELDVQRIQDVGVDLPSFLAAQEGQDVLVDVAAVGVQGLAGDPKLAEVPIEQLGDRRGGPCVASLVDLVDEADPRGFSLVFRLRAGRDELHEAVPSLGDRVDARVDPDPQRLVAESIDGSSSPSTRGTHVRSEVRGIASRHQSDTRSSREPAIQHYPSCSSGISW